MYNPFNYDFKISKVLFSIIVSLIFNAAVFSEEAKMPPEDYFLQLLREKLLAMNPKENPEDIEEGKTFKDYLNPDSLRIITAMIEPSIKNARISDKYQFERIGYFSVDKDSTPENLVFNRVVSLKDSWSKMEKVNKA